MRDSVPSASYSSVCNVLRQWQSRSSLLIESTDSMIFTVNRDKGAFFDLTLTSRIVEGPIVYSR